MEAKDIISIVALGVSVLSLAWTFITNRKLEKYKAEVGIEKGYIEGKLVEESTLIRELLQALRDGRLLIEKIVQRKRSAKLEEVEKILGSLDEKYTKSILFFDQSSARIDGSSISVFVHELKNKIRNTIEKLLTADNLASVIVNNRLNEELEMIKKDERKLISQLRVLDETLLRSNKSRLVG